MKPSKIVAEIGCNHMGDLEIAKRMIAVAANFCGVDAVKFQKRCNRELLTPEQYNAPHPVPHNSYGSTYGEHREALEFNVGQHRELKEHCESHGLIYSTSVWDVTSAREMVKLDPTFLKVPSASNLHFEMLDVLCCEYDGGIQLSLGMTTRKEEEAIVEHFVRRKRIGSLVLYACTSGYPVPTGDIALLEIERLRRTYGGMVEAIGFSGHHLGISMDIAAVTLGAEWVERHYTLDRTWKGTDHAASLEPDGLRKLKRDTHALAGALEYKREEILEIEQPQRDKLKWRSPATA
jgi:sialic acid synthase